MPVEIFDAKMNPPQVKAMELGKGIEVTVDAGHYVIRATLPSGDVISCQRGVATGQSPVAFLLGSRSFPSRARAVAVKNTILSWSIRSPPPCRTAWQKRSNAGSGARSAVYGLAPQAP